MLSLAGATASMGASATTGVEIGSDLLDRLRKRRPERNASGLQLLHSCRWSAYDLAVKFLTF
jgi:hypothetical protein